MSDYRIMLVDDEEEVRSAILKKTDWRSLGYGEVIDAENGEDALEKMERFTPDVLLTDIRMPYLDGLVLCERVRKLYPHMKLLIFSGFDEFEYAKQAIRLNVSEFILKPVNLKELSAILKRTAEKLDEEIREQRNINALEESYRSALPILKQAFLSNLIRGGVPEKEIREKAPEYGIDLLDARKWVISAAELEEDTPSTALESGRKELSILQVRRFLTDTLKDYYRSEVYPAADNRLCIICAVDEENTQTDLIALLNEICRECRRILDHTVTIGVGHSAVRLSEADKAWQSAVEALRYKRGQLTGTAIYISDMQLESENASASVVAEAKEYITGHYHDPELSQEVICRHLHISPNYFSTIFKRETGETYIAYLTRIRMEKAVDLLKHTQLKTFAIAEQVGYQEQNYFSYVFKKTYGVSPSKFRSGLK